MVISFSSEKPRQQLLEKGYVYTFRKNRRKKFIEAARHYWRIPLKNWGHIDWANEGRTKPKFADVIIFEVGEFVLKNLKKYVHGSGFESLAEWGQEIARLNRWDEPRAHDKGWLYKVIRAPKEEEESG